jgi:pseudouridine synthase
MKKTGDLEHIRLNRYLAMLGAGSRRACDELIASGRVRVDGKRVSDPGHQVVPDVNQVAVDNILLTRPLWPIVLLLNKPTGVVSTVSDPKGRVTVLDLCKKYKKGRRLFPVGRLDVNTTGALLLTNDGSLCYRLTHPRFQIPRVYHVHVRGVLTEKKLIRMRKLATPPRNLAGPRGQVELVRDLDRISILKIRLHEGRNRQVRQMCESVGLQVVKLRRLSFGPINVRKLPLGAVRPLTKKELEMLRKMAV